MYPYDKFIICEKAVPKTVLLVQPGAFAATRPEVVKPGTTQLINLAIEPERVTVLGIKDNELDDCNLVGADVVVAAERGIGTQDNLKVVEQLAALFNNSSMAGSRPLCDMNWLNYNKQVGIAGTTVSPKLYIACGISGAFQHIVGMQNSDFIVAISKDPNAVIFRIADVCIVKDVVSFIPEFIQTYQKDKVDTGSTRCVNCI